MEYPTLITTGASTRFRALGMRTIESLTLHELAHQWFYGMLASDEHLRARMHATDAVVVIPDGQHALDVQRLERAIERAVGACELLCAIPSFHHACMIAVYRPWGQAVS